MNEGEREKLSKARVSFICLSFTKSLGLEDSELAK
jgi:hypothetical protein